jgi:hypothetical protein
VGNQNESPLLAGNSKLIPIGYWQAIEIDTYWLSVGD